MKQNCLSCRNALRFFDGECNCFLEPCGENHHKDDYTCEHHEFVEETSYEERVAWKQRKEREKEILKNGKIQDC